jgi:ketol-acid reductoisomerase
MRKKGKVKKRIAVIGYGSQGRAIALNLRDSGFEILVGLRSRSASRRIAKTDGFRNICSVSEAVAEVDTVVFAFPDHLHGRVFRNEIAPHLRKRVTLVFLHGMSVAFNMVTPPADCDVILLAPHAPGTAVREKYLGDRSVSAFYAVLQGNTRAARSEVIALAEGIGIKPRQLIRTTFRDEAIGDMFGEQAVLCGGLAMLIKTGFDVLVEHGLRPEHAYLEVAYQLDLIVSLIKKYGVVGMLNNISVAARYGSLLTGPKIVGKQTKARMRKALSEIVSGRFPRKLATLQPGDIRAISKAVNTLTSPKLERAARRFSH